MSPCNIIEVSAQDCILGKLTLDFFKGNFIGSSKLYQSCVCNVFGHISLVYRIHLRFKFHQYPYVMYIVTSNCVAVFWLLPFKFECSKCFGGNKKLSSGIHQLCKSDVCQLLAVPPRGLIFC